SQGDFVPARSRHRESLMIGRELGNHEVIAHALEGFADLAVAQGQAERAAQLFGVAERLRETPDVRWEGQNIDYQRGLAAARTLLDEGAFAAAWAAGRAM